MDNQFNAPQEVVELSMKSSVGKATMPYLRMVLLGVMAGAFIALGAATSNTAVHDIANVGLARTLAGAVFPVGLMMIVFIGGELFTGNCLIFMDVLDKRLTWLQFVRDLFIVFFSNLLGSVIVSLIVYGSGNFDYTSGLLGAYTIKVMVTKVTITPFRALCSGILCNILVCAAIFMATAAVDIAGKVWAIFFPIFAFVIGGFEHVVANMYYITAGLLAAQNPVYVARAVEAYGLSAEQIQSINVLTTLNSYIPVTVGNVIGGAVCMGAMSYFAQMKKWSKK